jgi:hypothetical protein
VAFEYSVTAAAVSAAQDGTAAAVIDSASINDGNRFACFMFSPTTQEIKIFLKAAVRCSE